MNFILFNPDEWRGDYAGCYGHPLAPTPNLDRLAAEGTRFNQCHVQHPVCTPSRCSFMTGWYPHVRGHRTLWHTLGPDEPNLLRYLKEAGYDVQVGGKNDLLSPEALPLSVSDWQLGRRSTNAVRPSRGGRNPFDRGDPRYFSFLYEPVADSIEQLGDFAYVDGACQYLHDKTDDRPFCLFLPIGFPHCPYFAPPPWQDLVDPEALPPLRPPGLAGKPDFHDLIRTSRRLDELDGPFFRRVNAVYLGMIGVVDAMLGMLLDTLEQTGHAEDTTVIVFSDHGDWAGDYGLVEKWPNALDDTITRVPFVVRTPGGARGHVVQEVNELFDLFPTVMDLAGIRPRHTHFATSLLPQLGGAAGDVDRAAFAEGGYDVHEPHCFEGKPTDAICGDPNSIYYPKGLLQQTQPASVRRSLMVRTATHKLIHRPGGGSELYDLEADSSELRNRYDDPAYAGTRGTLERRLLDRLATTSDVTPLDPRPREFVSV